MIEPNTAARTICCDGGLPSSALSGAKARTIGPTVKAQTSVGSPIPICRCPSTLEASLSRGQAGLERRQWSTSIQSVRVLAPVSHARKYIMGRLVVIFFFPMSRRMAIIGGGMFKWCLFGSVSIVRYQRLVTTNQPIGIAIR